MQEAAEVVGETAAEWFLSAEERGNPATANNLGFNEREASDLAGVVNGAGGVLLLDARIRRGGSHHQKLLLGEAALRYLYHIGSLIS